MTESPGRLLLLDSASMYFRAFFGMPEYAAPDGTNVNAVRGMLDYVFGRQEENAELTMFTAAKLELRAGRRKHAMVMIDGEIRRMEFPLELTVRPRHLKVLSTPEILAEDA